jgi:hypothetical protein
VRQEQTSVQSLDASLVALLAISQLAYIVTVATLGGRLLLLARRTRELPELLLAIHFVLCCTVGYLLLAIALPATQQPGLLPARVLGPMIGMGHLACSVGVLAGIGFNYVVFRRDRRWAHRLVWMSGLALAIGYLGYGASGDFSTGRFAGPWFWSMYGTYTLGAAWVMVEPLRHYRVACRRRRLGLVDPTVANRFLLWGSGSVCRFVMLVVGPVPTLLMSLPSFEAWAAATALTFSVVALAGIGVSGAYWLAFFPPRAYVRFVMRRHARAGAQRDGASGSASNRPVC